MSTKPTTDGESNVEQPATESDDVELPRSFLVEASGPVEKVTQVSDGLSEREQTEVSIVRHADTLSAFDAFYSERNKRSWKTNVVQRLLSEEALEDVVYEFDATEWDVQIDGRVGAFRGVIDTLADPDLEIGDPYTNDGNYSQVLTDLHRSVATTETRDEDEAFADLVDDCRQSPLFGPGAAIAKLDAKHAEREDLEGYIKRLYEDVHENGGGD